MSLKDTIGRSVLKCGISNRLDKSEEHLTNIHGREDYKMPAPEKEFYLLRDEEIDNSSVESEMSYDEGNADENSSSENFSADSSTDDC